MAEGTIIISRSGSGQPERRKFETELVGHLGPLRAGQVLVISSIYWLKTPSPALEALQAAKGGLIVAAWMQPRAIYWILQYHGIEGQLSPQHVDDEYVAKPDNRVIRCLNMADFASPEAGAHALAEAEVAQHHNMGTTRVECIEEALEARWYPVIDQSKCCNCNQCFDFCLFGVYEGGEGKQVRVSNPGSCKPGCPACARVCPKGAIMFPEYEADARIAGAEGAEPSGKPDEDASEPGDEDDLDNLIDELDKLDE